MKRERNKGNGKLSKLVTYSTKEATYIIKRSTNRRSLKIAEFILKTDAEYLTPNFALTIVWHALKTAGDRRDGNILGMPPRKRQEHFLRKIRRLAQRLGFSVITFGYAAWAVEWGNICIWLFIGNSPHFSTL